MGAVVLASLLAAAIVRGPAPRAASAGPPPPLPPPAPAPPAVDRPTGRGFVPVTAAEWVGADGRHRLLYSPEFQPAPTLLENAKALGLPGVELDIDAPRGRLLLTASAEVLPSAVRAIRYLDTATPQAVVEIWVVEVARKDRTESGGHLLFDRGKTVAPEAPDSFFRSVRYDFEPDSWLRSTLSRQEPFEGTSLGLGLKGAEADDGLFDQVLRGLSQQGEAEFVANPLLALTEGIPARLESTVDLPETVFVETNIGLTSQVRHERAGVVIEATARRIGTDHVILALSVWLRQIVESSNTGGPLGYPVLASRELKTVLTLADRQEAIVGGMELGHRSKDRKGLPFVPGIPGLDALASTHLSEGGTTEIVFRVRPVIVTPGRSAERAAPPGEAERCARAAEPTRPLPPPRLLPAPASTSTR